MPILSQQSTNPLRTYLFIILTILDLESVVVLFLLCSVSLFLLLFCLCCSLHGTVGTLGRTSFYVRRSDTHMLLLVVRAFDDVHLDLFNFVFRVNVDVSTNFLRCSSGALTDIEAPRLLPAFSVRWKCPRLLDLSTVSAQRPSPSEEVWVVRLLAASAGVHTRVCGRRYPVRRLATQESSTEIFSD